MSDSEYLAEAADTLHGLGRTDSDYSLLKVLLDNGALNVARTRRCIFGPAPAPFRSSESDALPDGDWIKQ